MAENSWYLSLSQEKREEYDRLKAIERERDREIETRRAKGCFDAEINDDGKYFCPECKKVEGGTLRTLTHNFGCTNKGLKICQLSQEQSAGRKRRRNKTNKKTKKTNKTKKQKRSTKVRKSMRRHRKH
jgi:hypothetical protein